MKIFRPPTIVCFVACAPLLGACSLLNREVDCSEREPYHVAREVGPLMVPEGQTAPRQRPDRRIPDIKSTDEAEFGRCLELPPSVLSNESRLAIAEAGVPVERQAAGRSRVEPWPQLATSGWVSIDPLDGADLRKPLQPGLPAWRIHDLLQDWAAAWTRQEVDPYFAFYAGSFVPENGQNWSQWRNDRLALVVGQPEVDVSVYGAEALVVGTDALAVRFTERYRAASTASVARKEMILVREGDVWSIKRERQVESPPAP